MGILFCLTVILIVLPICLFLSAKEKQRENKEREKNAIKRRQAKKARAISKRENNRHAAIEKLNREISDQDKLKNRKKTASKHCGPFGLKSGMLKAHIQTDVELNKPENGADKDFAYIKPPNPYPLFDMYSGIFNNGRLSSTIAIRARTGDDYEELFNETEVAYEIISNTVNNKYYRGGAQGLRNAIEIARDLDQSFSISLERNFQSNEERVIAEQTLLDTMPGSVKEKFSKEELKMVRMRITGQKNGTKYMSRLYLIYSFKHPNFSFEQKKAGNKAGQVNMDDYSDCL